MVMGHQQRLYCLCTDDDGVRHVATVPAGITPRNRSKRWPLRPAKTWPFTVAVTAPRPPRWSVGQRCMEQKVAPDMVPLSCT